jgi:hypothetical protein
MQKNHDSNNKSCSIGQDLQLNTELLYTLFLDVRMTRPFPRILSAALEALFGRLQLILYDNNNNGSENRIHLFRYQCIPSQALCIEPL